MVVNLNENLHLKCDVDSNPKASILWIVNDTKIYNQPLLLISSIKAENYGTYKCLVTTRDFPDIYASVKVIPPGNLCQKNLEENTLKMCFIILRSPCN